jgi:CMP-N,N'-diacetyllegionaminic acid synthase
MDVVICGGKEIAMQILGIIPARGGSKSIPRKSIRPLAGKPLIAWTIKTALSCPTLDRAIVSTDAQEIAEIAQQYGAELPFIRPTELAQDDTPDLPVYQHALSWLAEHEDYYSDIVVWLRPTAPLRIVQDVEAAIQLLIETGADCVRSVSLAEHHPYWMKRLDGDCLVPFVDGIDESTYYRRQLLPPAYRLNGAVDVTWCRTVMEKGLLYGGDVRGYVMPTERSIDLDTELDFALAELLLQMREP